MAIRTREEIITTLGEIFGDRTDDEVLNIVTDISDTFTHLNENQRTENDVDWEKKYRENDEEWRKKYRDTFYGSLTNPETLKQEEKTKEEKAKERAETITFDDLFE